MRYQILLIDDEPAILLHLQQLISWEQTPYHICHTAKNGLEALNYLDGHEVDFIITDLKMPVMDGITLIKTLAERNISTPVLVLSNYSDFELVREAITAGAKDYLLNVNITSDILMKQLDVMVSHIEQNIREARERQIHEELMQEKQSKEHVENLLSFLTEDTYEADPGLLEGLPLFEKPVVLFLLSFYEMNSQKLKKLLPNIRKLIQMTFRPDTDFILELLPQRKLVCCIPAPDSAFEYSVSGYRNLAGQLSTYFSTNAVISYSFIPCTVSDIRERYRQCLSAFELLFFQPKSTLIDASSLLFQWETDSTEISEFSSLLLNLLHNPDEKAVREIVEKYFDLWSDKNLFPAIFREQCTKIIDYISFSIGSSVDYSKLSSIQKLFLQMQTITELKEALVCGIMEIYRLNRTSSKTLKKEIQDVLLFINIHYTEKITLDSIADSIGLNKSYLCRLFRKEYGCSMFQYLNEMRLKKAVELLRSNPNMYIKELAEETGFSDPFYFTRRFHDYYGMSPTAYASESET